MPKGPITMLGRIMAGSPAVMAHHATGHAGLVTSYPPAIPLSQRLVAFCQQGVEAPGSVRCVIARAVNAVALAGAFDAQGVGVLSLRDDHEPEGLERCEATSVGTLEEGTMVESGPWNVPRAEDPRPWVIVEPAEGKTGVYWGTPTVKDALEATAWPRVSRGRNAMQAHSCKRMRDHGARKTHEGRKTIVGPDRQQQRAREQRAQSLRTAQPRVDKQAAAVQAHQDKVAESESAGQGTRLAQRQRAVGEVAKARQVAQHHQAPLREHASASGPPTQWADRAFRTQTIMTWRTLRLDNALMACMVVLGGPLQTKGSLACL
jgi:hypothetical protein